MEPLQARILIAYIQGAPIAYLYFREAFDLLNIEKHTYDGGQFIEVGKTFEYDGKKYVVKSVNFKMFKDLYANNNEYGMNLHSPTDLGDYNCQIGVFVDEA